MFNKEDLKIGNVFYKDFGWKTIDNYERLQYYKILDINDGVYSIVYGKDSKNFNGVVYTFYFDGLDPKASLFIKQNETVEIILLKSNYRLDEII